MLLRDVLLLGVAVGPNLVGLDVGAGQVAQGSASPEQLAGGLDQQTRSGAFRMKVATTRTFGVVSVSRGNVALTPLGRRIIDPEARPAARVEAFKAVPLFSALLAEYNGRRCPPIPVWNGRSLIWASA